MDIVPAPGVANSSCNSCIIETPSVAELLPVSSLADGLREPLTSAFTETPVVGEQIVSIPSGDGNPETDGNTPSGQKTGWFRQWISVLGPGLVVMLADTDAGCLITAANTGATWGYALIWLQLVLVSVLYMGQELTVRLGLFTGKGHGELIQENFGKSWAWVSAGTLIIACTGALVSEISGVAGVGLMFGIPAPASACTAAVILLIIVFSGKYRHVEKIALLFGICEFTYIVTMFLTFSPTGFVSSAGRIEIQNNGYSFLVSANIGAVVMPWMIFYQQSAVVDKKLQPKDLRSMRIDTFVGACITQIVMCAVISTSAGSIWVEAGSQFPNPDPPQEIGDYSAAIEAKLGSAAGKALFSIGLLGGAFVGAIVVGLTAAWGLGEVTGYKRSLELRPRDAPWFYVVFILVLATGIAITLSPLNLVYVNLVIQIMNALLLPIVLGLLWALAVKVLPEEQKLKGWYKWFCAAVFGVCCGLGVFGGIFGLLTGAALG